MITFHRSFISSLFLLLASAALMAEETPAVSPLSASALQQAWDHANFEIADNKQKANALETLSAKARDAAAQQPADAAVQIWTGIILSTYAGEAGMSALGLVKDAKKYFEKAMTLDANALQGAAYTSLGSLYYQVPGWPVGFGDDDKAEDLLQKGLAIDPDGIDANYFYADFLMTQKHFAKAAGHYEKVLAAIARPGRESADKGRMLQAQNGLEQARKKIK